MLTAREIIDIYISFFEHRKHQQIPNSSLIPENDPTTLFTSSGMQPLVNYLLGEIHPGGKRLVNVQNCFRAVDMDEVGDNRHTTFFRMLGNWSLGDYFKKEEIPWLWEFLTEELGLPKEKLFITVFEGYKNVKRDEESYQIWSQMLTKEGFEPEKKIFFAGPDKNWWSRSGVPDNMPAGEPGGPDTEVYFRFDDIKHNKECKDNPVECECGKFMEIANAVFMQYAKTEDGSFKELPQKNVDFGGGLERLLAAAQNKSDIFQTSLFLPTIQIIEQETGKNYTGYAKQMRVISDHLTASVFISNANIKPSNKEQGYILRRLLRRCFDNFYNLSGKDISSIIYKIVEQYKETDPDLEENFEEIKLTILEEEKNYKGTLQRAKSFIDKRYKGEEMNGIKEISAGDAFLLYSTHGLSPTQIESLGYIFNKQEFAEKMEEHQKLSRTGAEKKFTGGLADHSEQVIKGHTATHLLHQALRDLLGKEVHQIGSNITAERIRFDFSFDRKLTEEEIKKIEETVNGKIKENLPVTFKIMDIKEARKTGAIGLFGEKYAEKVKVYFIGEDSSADSGWAYSAEFCGGPHVDFTNELKGFKIIKQENIGQGRRRIYAVLAE